MINEERLKYLKIIKNKTMTFPELRKALGDGYTHTRMSHMLRKMEADGFIERSPYQRGFVRSLWLTDKGKRCAKL